MERLARTAVLIAAAISATACFKTPLGPPGRPGTNPRLLASWQCSSLRPVEEHADSRLSLDIMRFDESQYYVEARSGGELTRYRMHATRIHGVDLFNLEELTDKFNPWPWSVARLVVKSDGTLQVDLVDDDERLAKLSDDQAKAFIRRHIADPTLYHPLLACMAHED